MINICIYNHPFEVYITMINTITKRTTKVKSQVAQIGQQGRALDKGGIASKGRHKVWNQSRSYS
jgi:hypothetical protein